MRRPKRSKIPVDLDQPRQQSGCRHRLVPVGGPCKLVEVVPNPRQLPQKLWRDRRRLPPRPQPQPPVAATSQAELNAYIGAVFGWAAKASA